MNVRIEEAILGNLLVSDTYARKVIPFLRDEYFSDRTEKIVLKTAVDFFTKYNKVCDERILKIEISGRKDLSEKEFQDISEYVDNLNKEKFSKEWVIDKTEQFCKKKAVFNAILDSIEIIEGKDQNRKDDAIPSILSEALAISFNSAVGHDYIEDAIERYEFYQSKEEGIPFDIEYLNKITNGVGLRKKTLTCIAAQTGGGKSLMMTHIAAATLMLCKNVLYITMEMSEKRIAQRIDANLFNTPINQLKDLDESSFNARVARIAAKSTGKLVVKEFPTSSAHSGHFRALLEELQTKRGFVPDLIVIDYLNICASSRVRQGGSVNSYSYIKSIAEEIRGLAVEFNVPILTATQVNRNGVNNSDIEMTDTSESMGLVHALDLYFAIINTEELAELNQIMIKQLKNRYGDENYYKRFIVGIDKSRMKLYNVEASAQQGVSEAGTTDEDEEDKPLFDRSKGRRSIGGGFNFGE